MGRGGIHIGYWSERDNQEDQDVVERIILKLILEIV
jgi:hypothetical protein